MGLPERGCHAGPIDRMHVEERELKRESRFRSLVFVDPIGVQAVATTAGRCIVKGSLKFVVTEKPFENATASVDPPLVSGCPHSFEASGHGRPGFDRLLIEPRLRPVPFEKAVGADRCEISILQRLNGQKPFQRLTAYSEHL